MRRLVGFGAIHCFGSSKEKKSRYDTYMYRYLFRFVYGKYGFVGYETLITLSLPMFGLEEPYLCIEMIFVGISSVLWLILDFG